MVQQITKGIKVSVEPGFEGTFYSEDRLQYAFTYTITIENQSQETVQLQTRKWKIKDALNKTEIVEGEGVVGQKPLLRPGQYHTYSSGCLLYSPMGSMHGYYQMVEINSARSFKVTIPCFRLNAPFAIN